MNFLLFELSIIRTNFPSPLRVQIIESLLYFKIILRKEKKEQTDFKNIFSSQKNVEIFQYDFRKLLGTLIF